MARDQKLNVEITADDKASAKITDVAKKVDRTDGKRAEVKVDANTKGAISGLDGIADALEDLGVPVGNLAGKLGGLASPGGAIAAIGAGLLLAANRAADIAIEADNLAALTGDTVEQASRLNEVWKQTGADSKDLQDVLLQMNGVLAGNADLAEQLGLNLSDGATVGQRFEQVAEALDRIPDAAERSQLASQLFGEEGVRQYTAMRQAVGDLGEALENVPDGAVISEEDVERARETKREMAELKVELQAFATTIGSEVLPAVNALFSGLNDLFDGAEQTGRSIRRFFDETADKNWTYVDNMDAASAAARDFDTTLIEGLRTYDDVSAAALAYGRDTLKLAEAERFANEVANEWYKTNQELSDMMRDKRTAVDEAGASVSGYDEQLTILAATESAAAEQTDKLNRELAESREKADKASRAIQELDSDWQRMKRGMSDQKALIDVQRAFETLGVEAAAALEAGEQATLDQQEALIDLKSEVGQYAEEVLNLPDASITVIQALIDSGKIAEAEAQLAWLSRGRDIPLTPKVKNTNVPGGNSFYARGTPSAAPGLAIVGEEGPELVELQGGERIHTAAQTRQMLQGGGGAQTVTTPAAENVTINVTVTPVTDNRQTVNWHETARLTGREIVDALNSWYRAGGAPPKPHRGWH